MSPQVATPLAAMAIALTVSLGCASTPAVSSSPSAAVATVAIAEPEPSEEEPPDEGDARTPATPEEPTKVAPRDDPEARAEAKRLFAEAMRQFRKQEFEAALGKFEGSYEAVPSPNSLLMQGRCLAELGQLEHARVRLEKAIVAAELAAVDQPKYSRTVEAARAALGDVERQLSAP